MTTQAITTEERNKIVRAYADARNELRRVEIAYNETTDGGRDEDRLHARLLFLADQLVEFVKQYRSWLPVVPISRCPFTGTVCRHSFDRCGLDGLWWDAEAPIRPEQEAQAGAYFLGLTGAMAISEAIEDTPFFVRPGPAVPFVLPRLLHFPEVAAVMTSGLVGRHSAFAITYFAQRPITQVRAPTVWGTEHLSRGTEGIRSTDTAPDNKDDADFDLPRWIEARKLFWIAPGDSSLTLRGEAKNCPYLNLAGTTSFQFVKDGEVWT